MKHLSPEQFLNWIETGEAESDARDHIQKCSACSAELAGLREVYHHMSAEESPAMPASLADHFAADLSRKIRLLPQRRSLWGFLQHALLEHYVIIGVAATAVVVCALALVFKYDKIQSLPAFHGYHASATPSLADELNDSMAVADELATNSNLQPTDFVRVSAAAEDTGTEDEALTTAFTTDPFHSIDDLNPQEMQQLKKLLQADLKG